MGMSVRRNRPDFAHCRVPFVVVVRPRHTNRIRQATHGLQGIHGNCRRFILPVAKSNGSDGGWAGPSGALHGPAQAGGQRPAACGDRPPGRRGELGGPLSSQALALPGIPLDLAREAGVEGCLSWGPSGSRSPETGAAERPGSTVRGDPTGAGRITVRRGKRRGRKGRRARSSTPTPAGGHTRSTVEGKEPEALASGLSSLVRAYRLELGRSGFELVEVQVALELARTWHAFECIPGGFPVGAPTGAGCGLEFRVARPRPELVRANGAMVWCPRCGSSYVEWLSFDVDPLDVFLGPGCGSGRPGDRGPEEDLVPAGCLTRRPQAITW